MHFGLTVRLEGNLVRISMDEIDGWLKEMNVCDEDRELLMNIVKFCFAQKASAVILFINRTHGNYRCTGYLPVYDNKDILKQYRADFKDIKESLFINAELVDNIEELKDEDLLFTLKRKASGVANWEGNYAILVFRREE